MILFEDKFLNFTKALRLKLLILVEVSATQAAVETVPNCCYGTPELFITPEDVSMNLLNDLMLTLCGYRGIVISRRTAEQMKNCGCIIDSATTNLANDTWAALDSDRMTSKIWPKLDVKRAGKLLKFQNILTRGRWRTCTPPTWHIRCLIIQGPLRPIIYEHRQLHLEPWFL